MDKINIAVIGTGRWGKNYIKTLDALPNASITWACSRKEENAKEALQGTKSKARISTDYEEVLHDKSLNAVAIATDGSTHYQITKDALMAGKHVLSEKPLAFSSKKVEELSKLALTKDKVLMVSDIHRFNPGITRLKEDIKKGLFGKISHVNLFHSGNGPVRNDMSALWDFFPHSASIILNLLDEMPISVTAHGKASINKKFEDIVTADFEFKSGIFTTATGTWSYPIKRMEIAVAGEKKLAIFDDYAENEKLRYCNPGSYNYEKIKIGNEKSLTEQITHFVECCEKNILQKNKDAIKIARILESAENSLRTGNTATIDQA